MSLIEPLRTEVVLKSDYDALAEQLGLCHIDQLNAEARIRKLEAALREIAEGRIGADLAAGKHVDSVTAARICGLARRALVGSPLSDTTLETDCDHDLQHTTHTMVVASYPDYQTATCRVCGAQFSTDVGDSTENRKDGHG